MSGQSLGLIETVGLAAAVVAADAAMKSANVNLVGYELTKGGGMVTVKFEGEVGAINAAVAAGIGAVSSPGQVYAHKVIARTAEYIDTFIRSADTVGVEAPEPEAAPQAAGREIPIVNVEESLPESSCMGSSQTSEPEKTQPPQPETDKKGPRSGGNKKR